MPRRGSATKRKDEVEDTSPATKKVRKPRLDRALFAKQDKSEDKAEDKSQDKAQDKAEDKSQDKAQDNPTSDEDEESDDDVVDLTAQVKTEASTSEPATRETKVKAAVDPMEVYSFVHETSSPHPVVASISQHVEYLISVRLHDVEKRVQAVETTSVATKQWVSNLEQTMKRNFREIPQSPALKSVSGTPVMSKTPQAATVATPVATTANAVTPVAATTNAVTPVAATTNAVTPVAATMNAVTPVAATTNTVTPVAAAGVVPKPAAPIAVSATPPKVECTPHKHQSPKFDASTGAIYCAACGDILKMPTK